MATMKEIWHCPRSSCGADVDLNWILCPHCGQSLREGGRATAIMQAQNFTPPPDASGDESSDLDGWFCGLCRPRGSKSKQKKRSKRKNPSHTASAGGTGTVLRPVATEHNKKAEIKPAPQATSAVVTMPEDQTKKADTKPAPQVAGAAVAESENNKADVKRPGAGPKSDLEQYPKLPEAPPPDVSALPATWALVAGAPRPTKSLGQSLAPSTQAMHSLDPPDFEPERLDVRVKQFDGVKCQVCGQATPTELCPCLHKDRKEFHEVAWYIMHAVIPGSECQLCDTGGRRLHTTEEHEVVRWYDHPGNPSLPQEWLKCYQPFPTRYMPTFEVQPYEVLRNEMIARYDRAEHLGMPRSVESNTSSVNPPRFGTQLGASTKPGDKPVVQNFEPPKSGWVASGILMPSEGWINHLKPRVDQINLPVLQKMLDDVRRLHSDTGYRRGNGWKPSAPWAQKHHRDEAMKLHRSIWHMLREVEVQLYPETGPLEQPPPRSQPSSMVSKNRLRSKSRLYRLSQVYGFETMVGGRSDWIKPKWADVEEEPDYPHPQFWPNDYEDQVQVLRQWTTYIHIVCADGVVRKFEKWYCEEIEVIKKIMCEPLSFMRDQAVKSALDIYLGSNLLAVKKLVADLNAQTEAITTPVKLPNDTPDKVKRDVRASFEKYLTKIELSIEVLNNEKAVRERARTMGDNQDQKNAWCRLLGWDLPDQSDVECAPLRLAWPAAFIDPLGLIQPSAS